MSGEELKYTDWKSPYQCIKQMQNTRIPMKTAQQPNNADFGEDFAVLDPRHEFYGTWHDVSASKNHVMVCEL